MLVKHAVIIKDIQRQLFNRCSIGIRSIATASSATDSSLSKEAEKQTSDIEWENARPFEEIPGPTILQFLLRALPGGKYFNQDLYDLHRLFRDEYGNLVKLRGMFGRKPIIFTFDENNIEKVFRTETVQPVRNGQDSLFYYRKELRKNVFGDMSGLVTEHGDNWQNLRSKVNPIMLMPKTVKKYIPSVDKVSVDFIERMRDIRGADNEMPANFAEELNKWALESIGTIALDTRLGCLDTKSNPEIEQFILMIRKFFSLSYELDVEPSIWKYYKTPKFNELMSVFDSVHKQVTTYVDAAIERLNNNSSKASDHEESVLEKLLKIDRHAAIIMASDMLLAGVDTTSSYLISCLYQLGCNPDKQEKLREEVNKILPTSDSPLTEESLQNAPYLRACLKESLRLNPIIAGNFRATGQDIVLSGYRVPKGVDIAMANVVIGWDDKHFEQHQKFIPERWLKGSASDECPIRNKKDLHPYIYLPFGHGPRTCIGRRFAELEVEVMILRLIKEFKIEWKYGPLKYKLSLINFPTNELKFTCIDIKK